MRGSLDLKSANMAVSDAYVYPQLGGFHFNFSMYDKSQFINGIEATVQDLVFSKPQNRNIELLLADFLDFYYSKDRNAETSDYRAWFRSLEQVFWSFWQFIGKFDNDTLQLFNVQFLVIIKV